MRTEGTGGVPTGAPTKPDGAEVVQCGDMTYVYLRKDDGWQCIITRLDGFQYIGKKAKTKQEAMCNANTKLPTSGEDYPRWRSISRGYGDD